MIAIHLIRTQKVVQVGTKNNTMEQHGRRNNLEVGGIPTSISGNELQKTVVGILNSINVDLDNFDVEACHKIGKTNDGKTIIHKMNCKFCKMALPNRKKLPSVVINDDEIH